MITLDRALLAAAVKAVAPFIARRPLAPSLGHVLLTVSGDILEATAGDGDNFAVCRLTLSAPQPDLSLLIDGSLLDRLLAAPGDTVELVPEEQSCTVKLGRSRYKLALLDPDSYPSLPAADDLEPLCSGALFKTAVGQTADFAQRGAEAKWQESLLLRGEDGVLDFVAGSGKTAISVYRVPGFERRLYALLQPERVKTFAAHVNPDDDPVLISERGGTLRYGSLTVHLALLDAQWPEYRPFLTTPETVKVSVERDAMLGALGRLLHLYDDGQSRAVSLRMQPEEDELLLDVPKAQRGTGSEHVPAHITGAISFDIDVNHLHTVVKAAPAGMLHIAQCGTPYRITSSGDADWCAVMVGVARN